MDRKYNLRLDLQFRCNNSVMKFRQSDNKTSDFFMRITSGGELFNIDNAIVILAVIKPNQTVQSQFLEVKEGKVYADLNPNMKDQVGIYKAQALLIYEDERVSTDVIEYEVLEDNILNQLQTSVSTTEEFTMLQQMLSRLSIVENSENLRVENENSRVEAEKLREQAIEKIKNDATKLITDTKKEINDYKDAKDISINLDLTKYKEATTQDINNYKNTKNTEIDNYKNAKDLAIDNDLKQYKTNTTEDITQFKNTKNNELDEYKNAKNLEIDNYVITKNKEIDNYKLAKDIEIDNYKNLKDTEINAKLEEVDTAETLRVSAEQKRVIDHQSREQFLNSFESQLAQIESKNIEQDTRLKNVENKNKVQDVYIGGLFNENKDGRLSVEGEGNSLKLEGSKQGLVEVDKVVGNTFVNIANFSDKEYEFTLNSGQYYDTITLCDLSLIEVNTDYTLLFDIEIVNNTTTWSLGSNTKFVLGQGNSQNTVSGHPVINSISNNGISYNLWNTICYSTNVVKFNLSSLNTTYTKYFAIRPLYSGQLGEGQSITYKVKNLMLFKGDITLNPPKEYIEGLQSSFEENLVTQEMVNEGLEDVENLGKYKVPIRIVGKNLFDIKKYPLTTGWISRTTGTESGSSEWECTRDYIPIKSNTTYTLVTEMPTGSNPGYALYDGDKNFIGGSKHGTFLTSADTKFIRFTVNAGQTVMLCEGTYDLSTSYEDYFERTANVYLNSPLLENDEIVMKDGELCHYHKRSKVVLDGSNDEGIQFATTWSANADIVIFTSLITSNVAYADKNKNYLIADNVLTDTYNQWVVYKNGVNKISVQESSTSGNRLLWSLPKDEYTLDSFKQKLQSSPTTIVYELAEPYYEPIQADKLILECANNSTLHIDTVVPVESVSASYTGNVPSVYALEKTGITNTEDISVTQTAVDFLLMSSMGEVMMMSFNENTKGGNQMGAYFASRIMKKALKYEDVIRKYPEFKDDIDFILRSEGYEHLIVEIQ